MFRSHGFVFPRSPEFPNSGAASISICNAKKRLAQLEGNT